MATNNAVAHAQAVTQAAFTQGKVPAPYYLHLLMRAQRAAMPRVAGAGCSGQVGGTVRVQRHTAQAKQPARGHGSSYVHTPTATRAAWVGRKVRVQRMRNGVPYWAEFYVTTRAQVPVTP